MPEFANLLAHMAASAVQSVDRHTAQDVWSDERGATGKVGLHAAVAAWSVGRTDPARAERGSGERGH